MPQRAHAAASTLRGCVTSFPRGAEIHGHEQRAWGWLCCVPERCKARSSSAEGLYLPHPLHPPFPLCLTAGVNFTLSCHLLDKIISSWFPLDLSSESLSAELPPAASHEESAAAAGAAVPEASRKPGCSAVPGSRPLVCVPVSAHTNGAQGTRG